LCHSGRPPSHIQQLESLSEELQSSNEELQASNEEMVTSREELQSLNEELLTVNAQLQANIAEKEETNNDLNNFIASTDIPTLFLSKSLKIRRFSPAMSKLMPLLPADMGRPIADMSLDRLGPDLIDDVTDVLGRLEPLKKGDVPGECLVCEISPSIQDGKPPGRGCSCHLH